MSTVTCMKLLAEMWSRPAVARPRPRHLGLKTKTGTGKTKIDTKTTVDKTRIINKHKTIKPKINLFNIYTRCHTEM